MSCSHATGCPLFPLLNASLQGWREHYCDSTDRWKDCARYQLALTGERVPISLLPNGHRAAYLAEAAGAAAPHLSPQSSHGPGPSQTAGRFEPAHAPGRHHRTSQAAPSSPPPDRSARRTSGAKRGWWARLVDWMSGPA